MQMKHSHKAKKKCILKYKINKIYLQLVKYKLLMVLEEPHHMQMNHRHICKIKVHKFYLQSVKFRLLMVPVEPHHMQMRQRQIADFNKNDIKTNKPKNNTV